MARKEVGEPKYKIKDLVVENKVPYVFGESVPMEVVEIYITRYKIRYMCSAEVNGEKGEYWFLEKELDKYVV